MKTVYKEGRFSIKSENNEDFLLFRFDTLLHSGSYYECLKKITLAYWGF